MRGLSNVCKVWLILALPSFLMSGPIMELFPSVGPNPFLSPNWENYARNAVTALRLGVTSFGTPGTPAYYEQLVSAYGPPTVRPGELVSTTFESWKGQVPPPPGYGGEYGNALVMGLYLDGGSSVFYLKDLEFFGNFFGSSTSFSFAGEPFGYDLVGHYYGPDRIPGTADDVWYNELNPGSDSVPVDRIWYAGIAGLFYVTDPASLPGVIASIWSASFPYAQGGYRIWIGDQQVSAEERVAVVPEPGSLLLTAAGIALLRIRFLREKEV